MDNEYSGGCEGYFSQKGVTVFIILAVILFIYYGVTRGLNVWGNESMRGGKITDAGLSKASAGETFSGRKITDAGLSKVSAGR